MGDVFIIAYFSGYVIFILWLLIYWNRIRFDQTIDETVGNFVSIIIPCRNEAANLAATIDDLENQDYLPGKFEVIFINDHSTDGTESVIEKACKGNPIFHLINLDGSAGKKSAITEGIRQARGDLIALTDGDCRRKPGWLKSLVGKHESANNSLTFGLVRFTNPQGFFEKVLSLEQASLVGSGAALWKSGMPVMANGANMIFDKQKFLEVDGYSGNLHIPSGDDEFLLSKFRARNFKIGFSAHTNSIIETRPPESVKELIHQRVRWAGKWRASHNSRLKIMALLIFILQVLWLAGLAVAILNLTALAYFLLGSLLKAIFDFKFLRDVSARLGIKVYILPLLLLEIVYPFYVTFIAMISNFKGYEWKARNYPD